MLTEGSDNICLLTWNVFTIKPSLSRGYDLCLVLSDDRDDLGGPVGEVESVVPEEYGNGFV